jgi:hypothetical protein
VRPLFNPVYWVLGALFLAAAAVVAVTVGVSINATARQQAGPRRLSPAAVAGVTVAFLVTFCVLCGWSLTEKDPEATTERPKDEEIIGTWSLSEASLQVMKEEGGYTISTHTLTFRADGTFEMENNPDWWDGGPPEGGFYSDSGTWRLYRGEERWRICVDFERLRAVPQCFLLRGKKPPYVVYYFLGGTDPYQTMVYEKRED